MHLDADVGELVRAAHHDFTKRFPLTAGGRQPVHVVYGGMHLFTAETPSKLGQFAREQLSTFAETPEQLAQVFGLSSPLASEVHALVKAKLEAEPVEDFRIDAEDGYGQRADEEENEHARRAAEAVAALSKPPPFLGLRVKPLTVESAPRALTTLEVFFSTLGRRTPPGFIVTLPKVTDARQLEALTLTLERLEARFDLPRLRIEAMVESAPGLFDATGRLTLSSFIEATRGRLFAVHFGAYDFTASLDVVASRQRLTHPACDALRFLMQSAFAGTGVFVADGATTELPLVRHKGAQLTPQQRDENAALVHAAWKAHARNIDHALDAGLFQGWDLHPGQLVPRYVATFAFFRSARAAMTKRLSNFVAQLGRATSVGTAFDDAATGQGLLHFFLRGHACGAFSEAELSETGLSLDDFRSRDFVAIAKRLR